MSGPLEGLRVLDLGTRIAAPFCAGLLGEMVDPRWFDASAVAAAGNVAPMQMQAGFVALRPTQQLAKWVTVFERGHEPEFKRAFDAQIGDFKKAA